MLQTFKNIYYSAYFETKNTHGQPFVTGECNTENNTYYTTNKSALASSLVSAYSFGLTSLRLSQDRIENGLPQTFQPLNLAANDWFDTHYRDELKTVFQKISKSFTFALLLFVKYVYQLLLKRLIAKLSQPLKHLSLSKLFLEVVHNI